MCFIEKMNCIWIPKREDHVPDLIRTPGRVGYRGTSPLTRAKFIKRRACDYT